MGNDELDDMKKRISMLENNDNLIADHFQGLLEINTTQNQALKFHQKILWLFFILNFLWGLSLSSSFYFQLKNREIQKEMFELIKKEKEFFEIFIQNKD